MSSIKVAGAMKWLGISRHINSIVLILIAVVFFLAPAAITIRDLSDPCIRSTGIPRGAWDLHRAMSRPLARWARQRLASDRAAELSTADISGTEWPLFGSVFYLWATETLQDQWQRDRGPGTVAPNVYAATAVEAATDLVIDPRQAHWVQVHWGRDYLKTEDVFYRMLVIAALTSHARITGSTEHLALLREQVNSLAAELEASPHGLLDDYPGQCYPGDVLTAIAMIRRADSVLGTDHSAFAARAIRGFQGKALDARGMVPYFAIAPLGVADDTSRGCGNSYVGLFSPELWPDAARKWYDLYSHYFWQERWTCAGFREFPNNVARPDWYLDVDSGPVLKGFGCAACAFGVGAARVNGHFEQAYPLTAEMLVTSWPLPGGIRLLPRLLSNQADAPWLGEAAILFNLTRLPAAGVQMSTGGSLPGFVYIFLGLQLGFGLLLLLGAGWGLHSWRKDMTVAMISRPRLQFLIWAGLWIIFLVCLGIGQLLIGLLFLMGAQLIPRYHCPKVSPAPKTK